MSRLTASNNTAASASTVRMITMARLDFVGGALTAHDAVGNFVYNSETYTGVGEFGGIDTINESLEFRPQPMRLTLSGVPISAIDELDPVNYQGRDCDIFLGLLDEDMTLVDDPVPLWSGFMDYASQTIEQGASIIVVHCESRILDFRKPVISRFTDIEQQALHPGDLAFEFTASLQDQSLSWGGTRINRGGGGTGPTDPRNERNSTVRSLL